jgi:hypothetical protein
VGIQLFHRALLPLGARAAPHLPATTNAIITPLDIPKIGNIQLTHLTPNETFSIIVVYDGTLE